MTGWCGWTGSEIAVPQRRCPIWMLSLCPCVLQAEEANIFSENETYPRALLHWTRAAAQGQRPGQSRLPSPQRDWSLCLIGLSDWSASFPRVIGWGGVYKYNVNPLWREVTRVVLNWTVECWCKDRSSRQECVGDFINSRPNPHEGKSDLTGKSMKRSVVSL